MSDTVTVYVAGVNQLNNPAGKGGDEFRLSTSGSERDAVWYQVDRSIVHETLFGEDIRKGYLNPGDRASLNTLGITYESRDAVEGAGMSHYILWLKGNK